MEQYFFYDCNAGIQFFETEAACFAAAQQAIDTIREETDPDMGWPLEALAGLYIGRITHSAQEVNVEAKPPPEALDEDGVDAQGRCWAYVDYLCDYTMLPLPE